MPIQCYRNPHMTVNSYGAIGIKRISKGMTYQAEHALNVLVGFMAIFVSVVKTTLSLELWRLTRLTSLLLSWGNRKDYLTMAGLGKAVNFTPSVRNGIQKQEWKLGATSPIYRRGNKKNYREFQPNTACKILDYLLPKTLWLLAVLKPYLQHAISISN